MRLAGTVLVIVVLCGFGWYGYQSWARPSPAGDSPAPSGQVKPLFRCDGRTRCEKMTSCEEAMFFKQNCPATALDQDKDGIPCEVQWCQR